MCFSCHSGAEVDREAVEYERDLIDATLTDAFVEDKDRVRDAERKLQGQIDKLKKIRKEKGCPTAGAKLKQQSDFVVYKRADEDILNSARVIERAKAGKLVNGSGATCSELEKIVAIDKKAVQFEKDKLQAMGSAANPKSKKVVAEAEKAIAAQLKKLEELQRTKGC